MQLKGHYKSLAEMIEGNSYISYLPTQNGKVMKITNSELVSVATPVSFIPDYDEIQPGYSFKLPKKIPFNALQSIISFFRMHGLAENPTEAMIQVYWDKETYQYIFDCPSQEVNRIEVKSQTHVYDDSRYILVADVHSHHTMAGKFSAQDDRDDTQTRFYVVIGRLDRYFPEISCRVSNEGIFLDVKLEDLFCTPFESAYPEVWDKKIVKRETEPVDYSYDTFKVNHCFDHACYIYGKGKKNKETVAIVLQNGEISFEEGCEDISKDVKFQAAVEEAIQLMSL